MVSSPVSSSFVFFSVRDSFSISISILWVTVFIEGEVRWVSIQVVVAVAVVVVMVVFVMIILLLIIIGEHGCGMFFVSVEFVEKGERVSVFHEIFSVGEVLMELVLVSVVCDGDSHVGEEGEEEGLSVFLQGLGFFFSFFFVVIVVVIVVIIVVVVIVGGRGEGKGVVGGKGGSGDGVFDGEIDA